MLKKKLKKIYFKIVGPIKRKKFKCTDFTIISNNCFGGIIYRNNNLPYNTPTAGLFFMANDYIKFIYDMKNYLSKELTEIKIEDSNYYDYLKSINYNAPIGKLGDVEIMFLHYPTFEEAKEKWDRRKQRINYDKIIYKFSEQNNCTYEDLKKFEEFNALNKLCFTFNKYDDLKCIQFTEFEKNPGMFNDSSERVFKKYFNIYDFVNNKLTFTPKVLMVVSDLLKCNGISSYVMNYFNQIDSKDVAIDFVVTSNKIDEIYKRDILNKKRNIYLIDYDANISLFKNVKKIKKFMRENSFKYDIIHSHLINKGYFYLKYAKKYGIHVRILHSHNTVLGDDKFIRKIVNEIFKKLAILNANTYFACSNLAGKYLFNRKKFEVINNAIDINKFIYNENWRNEYRKSLKIENKFVIGQVGRLSIQKNHLFFAEVMKKIIDKNKKIIWLIVGDGDLEFKIKDKVEELDIKDNVIFLGTKNDVNKLYSAIDLFVLPSLYEGLPVVAVEAQASGVKCILSDTITQEVNISKNVSFVPLNEKKWVETISSYKNENKRFVFEKEKFLKYNIYTESEVLKNKYISLIKNNN